MSNKNELPPSPLPPLPHLEVVRSSYCSQEVTDRALQYLWDNAPDLVRNLAKREHLDFDQEYLMGVGAVIEFLDKAPKDALKIPTSHLGMQDLLFELSRRLRKMLSIPEWPIKGRPLGEGDPDAMPELPVIPIRSVSHSSSSYVSQEATDRIISAAYRQRPELFYEFAESLRRGGIGPYSIFNELVGMLPQVASPEDGLTSTQAISIGGEINRRLRKYCGIEDAPI